MKKISSLILAGAVMFGLASCSNDDGVNTPDVQGTGSYGAVTAKLMRNDGFRALNEGQSDVAGIGGEDLIANGYMFIQDGISRDLKFTQVGTTLAYKSDIFETKPQNGVNYALLLNRNNLALNNSAFSKTHTVDLSDLKKFIANEGFMMTSTVQATENTINISEKTKEEVEKGSDETTNNFSLDVERVVAKVQLSKKETIDISDDLNAIGSVATDQKFTYAIAGSAKKSYLFRDNAGDRTLATDGNHIYKSFKSAIDGETTPNLQKVSDKDGDNYILDGYYSTAKEIATAATEKASTANGFFFFENSMYGGANVAAAKGDIKFNRVVYAKVYTKFEAKNGRKLEDINKAGTDEAKLVDADASAFTNERTYTVRVSMEWHDANKGKLGDRLKYVKADLDNNVDEYWTLDVIDKAGTFYVGADGLIYDTQLAAAEAGNKTYRKFDGGDMLYMVPANAQLAGDGVTINYCDTRRNNIYDLTVASIDALGENYDPIDPDDPNNPKPGDNPGEPTPDPEKPVQEPTAAMRVEAKILQWNLVNRDIHLGK